MIARYAIMIVILLAAGPARAESLDADAARRLGAKMRNNRIGTKGFLSQHCALAPDLESMLLARMRKVFCNNTAQS
jgi:hypothetical protein